MLQAITDDAVYIIHHMRECEAFFLNSIAILLDAEIYRFDRVAFIC